MTVPILNGTTEVPEETALLLRGIQTDTYGTVLGGHKAIFDPVQSGLSGVLASGDTVPNLVAGGDDATTLFDFVEDISTHKGIPFTDANVGAEAITLPDCFDFLTLGDDPTLVLSVTMTLVAPPDSGTQSAALSYTVNTTSGNQYYMGVWPDGTMSFTMSYIASAGIGKFAVPTNEPFTVTAHITPENGELLITVYLNGVQVDQYTKPNFNDPKEASASAEPRLGYGQPFSKTWEGAIHRLQLLKVNPDVFDIDAWMADEIAANAGRFDVA